MYEQQSRVGSAKSQFDAMQSQGNSGSKSSPISTIEQLLRVGDGSRWSQNSSSPSSFGKENDCEEDPIHHQKKSVLAKVKEKARKWRSTLTKSTSKKHNDDGNITPTWGVTLEDDEEEDPEYLGAPMYESEMAPEGYKVAARQNPRTVPVTDEKHVLATSVKPGEGQEKAPPSPDKKITKPVSEKFETGYESATDATDAITTKIQSLNVSPPESQAPAPWPAAKSPRGMAAVAADRQDNSGDQKWDKGVSVKEYIMQKLEPGEDEKALSQVISEAMSPRGSPGNGGMVEKVKDAVTSFLWTDKTSERTVYHCTDSSPKIPLSTNAQEVVEEESRGRALQPN